MKKSPKKSLKKNKGVLAIKNLTVRVGDREIVHDVTLNLKAGETHLLMGPNGSGKSSLLYALMGHPRYAITSGAITLDGKKITALATEDRARRGLFLSFQHPVEIPGVSIGNALRTAVNAVRAGASVKSQPLDPKTFAGMLQQAAEELDIDRALLSRAFNEGFSGGEKKKAEMLQMLLLKPSFAFLDEIDSGLDIDAVRTVLDAALDAQKKFTIGLLIVSHNPRILTLLKPDHVHVMAGGKIVVSGGDELVAKIEKKGFDSLIAS